MDPIKAKKLQAMKKYKKKALFLDNLILYSLTALICTLFCSYPLWFPTLYSSVNHFVFVSIPQFKSFFFNSKCLFIVGSVIIVYLVGESKLAGSCSSPATDIYDEYVQRCHSLRGASPLGEKKEEGKLEINLTEESVNMIIIQEEIYIAEKEKEEQMEDDHEDKAAVAEEREEEEEEEDDLPVEELNRRVEDFIARVNRRRWLEAKSLV